ncbi:hypothetical protein FLL78_09810 [Vibrio cholerae]|uniref:hypothetical protein n=1 Tax=Vibrio cholerae TaxID=666 RepID=UPI001158FFF4|nr:hypothetical protein [Vibrio cholerae]MCD6724637.1 hypothetical protein [Vibrio cholerae]TQQ03262.1 hypothetical protein FLL78_09810 [Vibrio cholerae]
MQVYRDINNDSGVRGYEIGSDRITVWFEGNQRSYTYTYETAGRIHVENMKVLAASGDGLNAYINRNVRSNFVR